MSELVPLMTGYTNLELNLEDGKRGNRYEHFAENLCKLTGAEAAIAVNNNAAAVLLMLTALASGGETVVSRGELVEIGGFRMYAARVERRLWKWGLPTGLIWRITKMQ